MAQVAMSWSDLKSIPAWTPLTALKVSPEHLGGTLFQLSPVQFLICPPVNERFERVAGVPGFVAAILWAQYEGAARRAILMEVEADKPDFRPVPEHPPLELLPSSGGDTYGSIIGDLRSEEHRNLLESATFRAAKDGAFVHRHISGPPFTFFFRSRKEDDNDHCYAIEYRLPGYKKAAQYAQALARQDDDRPGN